MSAVQAPRSSIDAALSLARDRMTPPIAELAAGSARPCGSGGDVISSLTLCRDRWDVEALAELCDRLGDDRRLFVVEPTAGLGLRRVGQWVLSRWWRRRLGYDFNRDLPLDLRRAGFQVHAIDRFTVGRAAVRTYFYAELGRRRHPGASNAELGRRRHP